MTSTMFNTSSNLLLMCLLSCCLFQGSNFNYSFSKVEAPYGVLKCYVIFYFMEYWKYTCTGLEAPDITPNGVNFLGFNVQGVPCQDAL